MDNRRSRSGHRGLFVDEVYERFWIVLAERLNQEQAACIVTVRQRFK